MPVRVKRRANAGIARDRDHTDKEQVGKMITDDALMAFVDWCRMNHGRFVHDKALVRRVFDAYSGLPEVEEPE